MQQRRLATLLLAALFTLIPACNHPPTCIYPDQQIRGPVVVVNILDREGNLISAGSGTVIRVEKQEDGTFKAYVLTACHVIFDATEETGANKVYVDLFDHEKFKVVSVPAVIVDFDMDVDAAILSLVSDYELPAAALDMRESPPQVWDEVITVGRDTAGIPRFWIGVINFFDGKWLGFTEPIHPGCSGGPLFVYHDGRWWVGGIVLRGGIQGFMPVYHCGLALIIQEVTGWLRTSEKVQFLVQ